MIDFFNIIIVIVVYFTIYGVSRYWIIRSNSKKIYLNEFLKKILCFKNYKKCYFPIEAVILQFGNTIGISMFLILSFLLEFELLKGVLMIYYIIIITVMHIASTFVK